MKYIFLFICVLTSSCATRHTPDTTSWFTDCYNKNKQEALLAKAEFQLSSNDLDSRRKIRKKYWDLQKECQ